MVITVINNKGGTGKTTTTVSLAGAFAKLGYHSLVIDLDPQASASISLGATSATLSPSISNVFFDEMSIKSAIRSSATPGVDLLTADEELYNTDVVFADASGREHLLRTAIDLVEDNYDFIICDCPPSFSMISINALVAADAYIVPVTPDYLALEDLNCIMGMVDQLKENVTIDAELLGILVTKTPHIHSIINPRARVAKNNIGQLRKCYSDDVFSVEIDTDVKLAEAPAYGTTVFSTAPSSRGAKQYMAAATELVKRCGVLKLQAESKRIARMRSQGNQNIVGHQPFSEWFGASGHNTASNRNHDLPQFTQHEWRPSDE